MKGWHLAARVIGTLAAVLADVGAAGAAGGVVLDQDGYWRRYYRFSVSRLSPGALKADGLRVLGRRGMARYQRDTERRMRRAGIDLAKADWRDHVDLAPGGARAFNPHPTPPPPAGWAAADFDDSGWVRARRPFQGGQAAEITSPVLGQYDGSVDLRHRAGYYRGRLVVDDPQDAGAMTVRLVYCGGARVLLNGREIARGHLPPGPLAADTPGAGYPAAAYKPAGAKLRRRTIGPVRIAPAILRKGVNVLAVEVRASDFHPIVLTHPTQPNWGGPRRPFPHARFVALELRSTSPAARYGGRRPSGVQVWAEDMHHRCDTDGYLPAGEHAGAVRLVGARGGTYSAQIVIGTEKALGGVQVRPGALTRATGGASIPRSAVRAFSMLPYPADQWTIRRLGDERGLAASFPTGRELSRYATMADRRKTYLFDQFRASPSWSVPAGACRPAWLLVTVPPDAAPGRYRGAAVVTARGIAPRSVPVELEVVDWRLPDPKGFRTLVGCEQNPCAVAAQYGVKLWSDEHFRLIEASFRQLGRIGNDWLNVPVIANTEFGNRGDSMIRWVRKRGGAMAFDYTILDRYLDVAVRHCGPPEVVQFTVMQGMPSPLTPPAAPKVTVRNEATGRSVLMPVGPVASGGAGVRQGWRAFATSLHAHMKARGLARAMYWGYPLEREADPGLKTHLAACTPSVGWIAGPHEMMANGTYAKNSRFYKIVADLRYHGGWRGFRDEKGWKSPTTHLHNPRPGGTVLALHTTSLPFVYRVLPDRAVAMGRNGFTRVGADEWAGVHYRGMAIPKWLTGISVLHVLWPGPNGAESGARFEAMREGIQEAEARIFLEQALDAGRVTGPLAAKVRSILAENARETGFLLGNSIIHAMEQYHYRWQERSARVYRAAAEVARAGWR